MKEHMKISFNVCGVGTYGQDLISNEGAVRNVEEKGMLNIRGKRIRKYRLQMSWKKNWKGIIQRDPEERSKVQILGADKASLGS